ncbi:hypothetical protein [Nocardia sp. alder85J]|uniref:hypothetical protein n=1 Tax=Nocardia sp. alder85J TaxID=2862949 RepID=UPI001CD57C1D|nr:hypothetical protein [Nocardia sp. alder85J]MCX4091824.1 hypothetical protein [Nocardia sp. alder85J]
MTVETVARVRVGGGVAVERLICHPRLPLIAGLDSARPAVHIWDARDLRALGTVGADAAGYEQDNAWERVLRAPATAWHPGEPVLMVSVAGTVLRWTPSGEFALAGLPPTAAYRGLAFGPGGRTLWATPAATAADSWERSDVIDLETGDIGAGPGWDTGVASHPAGGLALTLRSNQGATLGLFARVDERAAPAGLRVLRRALILDVDGYETPIFSPDGRYLAIRGNAYGNSLDVFEFPSLDNVLSMTLGDPSPGYPYPQEWLDRMRAWSRHNIAFGARPGVLWIGTPEGALVEADLDNQRSARHDTPTGAAVTALGVTAAGNLVVADADGALILVAADGATPAAAPEPVAAFLTGTTEVDPGTDLDSQLVLTDGARSWEPGDPATVDTVTDADPTWLRIQVQLNRIGGGPA